MSGSLILNVDAMHENDIGTIILASAFEMHTVFGPGLLESTYEASLTHELKSRGMIVETQLPLPVVYKEIKLDCGYRIDMRVNKKIIVEIKAVEALNDVHMAQVLTYMKLSGSRLGYLINFNVAHLKNGIKRVILGKL
jgi:GxxExxY protein